MRTIRPAISLDPRHFGRGMRRVDDPIAEVTSATDDLRLFATTFAAGFFFVSMLLV